MFETIRNAFKIKDVRNKILMTILFVVLYRLGCYITVPGLSAIDLSEDKMDIFGLVLPRHFSVDQRQHYRAGVDGRYSFSGKNGQGRRRR